MRKSLIILPLMALSVAGTAAGVNLDIPDRDGMSVKGVVYCGDTPLEGVQVSDGHEVAYTDQNGVYYLPSGKECGYVFFCNPAGYKAKVENRYPQFYKMLDNADEPTAVEQVDFELVADNSTRHAVVFMADLQFSDRIDDVWQYNTHVLPDVNATIDELGKDGSDVYLMTLGDQAYEKYWEKTNFLLPDVKLEIDKINATAIYNCMGNHDNDYSIAGDWTASETYRSIFGPTYYSFNAGDIHYVVLDNIEYLNPTACTDDRSYNVKIVQSQMDWLKKDLARLDRGNTRLVICMHAPLFKRAGVNTAAKFAFDGWCETLYNMVKDFYDVRIFSGHRHSNSTDVKGSNLIEYNQVAASADLWWTGQKSFTPGNHIAQCGSPGGYRVLVSDNGDIETWYQGVGFGRDVQFRAYDLNRCNITAERFCPRARYKSQLAEWLKDKKYGYDDTEYTNGVPINPNRVLINVFAYEPNWKVEVFEDGRRLAVRRVSRHDPLFIISGACGYLNTGKKLIGSASFDCNAYSHFFEVQASSATSTLEIKVTDADGNVFTETMERPRDLSIERYLPTYGGGAGIASPAVAGAEASGKVTYYNIYGQRISHPVSGQIYIRRQGDTSSLILFR